MELASAKFARAWAVAWLGDLHEARETYRELEQVLQHAMRAELHLELADLETELGDRSAADRALRSFAGDDPPSALQEMAISTRALLLIRLGEQAQARGLIEAASKTEPVPEPGRVSRMKAIRALAASMNEDEDAADIGIEAQAFAERQGATRHRIMAGLALAAVERRLDQELRVVPSNAHPVISVSAELVTMRLHELSEQSIEIATAEAIRRPDRWLATLRMRATGPSSDPARLPAARLLDVVGQQMDVPLLRRIAREPRRTTDDRRLGRGLARRLAHAANVVDLGRVRISIGERDVGGGEVRRKVLALLLLLITKPRMTATREEVMETLWPEIDPDAAINSLNQTVYFLRRVFEPEYQEDLSPGYVHQESDLVFLDPDLVDSMSRRCAKLVDEIDRSRTVDLVDALSETYVDRFAADFAYEDWAVDYRDWLHTGYLQIIETEIAQAIATGQYERGVRLARRALGVDPRLDSLGLSLLRLFKGSGAHAAAAEQYERYASLLRSEIGVEPPSFDAV